MDNQVTAPLGILGAGASGLSLALLTDLDYQLIESEDSPGGHAVSEAVDGWVFDRGPHIMFSRSSFLLECMVASLGDNVHQCRRNNRVAIAGSLARYPIENDLAALPLPLRSEAVLSYLAADRSAEGQENLAEWFTDNFGKVLVDTYFRPYNEKVWNIPLETMSMCWADRIPRPPVEDVIRGALGELSEGYLHQLHYSYPLHGGYSALMDAWASGIDTQRMRLGTTVNRITPNSKGVRVETDGSAFQFETVVSTLPLRLVPTIVDGVPTSVVDAIRRLIVNPMVVVTLGYRGVDENQFTAVYIADEDFLVNRVSFPAVFSPNNAPAGCFSIQAEITASTGADVLSWSDDQILEHVRTGLEIRGLVPDESLQAFANVARFDQAYVVYTRDYEEDLNVVASWLRDHNIIPHGRFGAHQYLNVDGCLDQSIALARTLGNPLADSDILRVFQNLGGTS